MRKNKQPLKKTRPKNVWNSIRKLEGYLRKADIQAGVFMHSLHELREAVSFEIKADIVQKLCNTVNGDLLHALLEHKLKTEAGQDRCNIEENAILLGIFEALENVLNLTPYRTDGERLTANKQAVREYDFDEHPEFLDSENAEKLEVEVLRCGWKIGGRIVIKPKVFEVKTRELITAGISRG